MLSRVAIARKLAPLTVANVRCSSSQPIWKREILVVKEHPDRDLVNFPRYKMPEHPSPVRMGFIPEEWFQFLYPKTGLTGPYVLGASLITTILSKEFMVVEEEFMFGLVFFSGVAVLHKLYGKDIAAAIDTVMEKEAAEEAKGLNEKRQFIEDSIKHEETAQLQTAAQEIIFAAKKENVGFQLEAEFRKRQLQVHQEVKRKLDYHLEIINIERRLQQKHMVDWIVSNVLKSISPTQEKEALSRCISDLKSLAARA